MKRESELQRRLPAMILFEEWGTSGRKRPTVSDLLELLIKVELFRAADFVAEDILNEVPPKRPTTGPAAKIDITLPPDMMAVRAIESLLEQVNYPKTASLVENISPSVNDVNKDYRVEVNLDRVKIIANTSELYSTPSSMATLNQSDLIKFSKSITNNLLQENTSSYNGTSQQEQSQSFTVFSSEQSLSNNMQNSERLLLTNYSNETNESSYVEPRFSEILKSKCETISNDAQIDAAIQNSITYLPDITTLRISTESDVDLNTRSHSMENSGNSESKLETSSDNTHQSDNYIPNISLLQGL